MRPHESMLTPAQLLACEDARRESPKVINGMAKWHVVFECGKGCTMLSDLCHTREEAIYAAIERFGRKVMNVH